MTTVTTIGKSAFSAQMICDEPYCGTIQSFEGKSPEGAVAVAFEAGWQRTGEVRNERGLCRLHACPR